MRFLKDRFDSVSASFEREVRDLAEHFLGGAGGPIDADEAWSLAGAIQQAVEDWFAARETGKGS